MPLIDLREHFGLWSRCGRTSFWRELLDSESNKLLVNPVDGAMISARDHPSVGGPALQVIVRDASDIGNADILHAYEQNYPWVEKVMTDFFKGVTLSKLTVIKESPQTFFVNYYEDQTPKFKETGKGHSDGTGKDELLQATKRVLLALGDKAIVIRKIILKDDWDEFLTQYGILEC